MNARRTKIFGRGTCALLMEEGIIERME